MRSAATGVSHGVWACCGRLRIAGPGGGGRYPPDGGGGGGYSLPPGGGGGGNDDGGGWSVMNGFPFAQYLLDWAALRYPRTPTTTLPPRKLRGGGASGRRRQARSRAQWFATRSNLPADHPATCVTRHRTGNPTSHTG